MQETMCLMCASNCSDYSIQLPHFAPPPFKETHVALSSLPALLVTYNQLGSSATSKGHDEWGCITCWPTSHTPGAPLMFLFPMFCLFKCYFACVMCSFYVSLHLACLPTGSGGSKCWSFQWRVFPLNWPAFAII